MWIVKLALSQPHTFVVLAITIALFGVISIFRMPTDIFPNIDIPVVSCVWTYTGMSAYDMENLVTTITERALTSTINGIDHMESMSLSNMSIIKVYLQKGTPMGEAVAMVTSVGSAILRQLPRGINPPFVTASSATDVPVIQLGLESDTLTEAQLFDIANNIVRNQLATVQGTITPFPYGGKFRQVMVDLDPLAMRSTGLSANDVVKAVNNQSILHPCGSVKMGPYEYFAVLNDIPEKISELNNIPIKTQKNAVVFLGDVGQAHDGYQPQLNIVNLDGHRAVLFNVLKAGSASTLSVTQGVKNLLPRIKQIVPANCNIRILTDQSIFVRDCVSDVVQEAVTAAGLTAIMMLALLGSWRSTLIVATSIPLAVLSAIIALNVSGQTINSMTLGGMALAVGMLVDDATVAIENIHRHLDLGKRIGEAILEGSEQVAMPALVSTMSICIVFIPLLLLPEPSHSLFVPLGMSVVFAMLSSYGLSRTVVPLMAKALLSTGGHAAASATSFFGKIHDLIERQFENARCHYRDSLAWALERWRLVVALFVGFYAVSFCLLPMIGKDFFPSIDAGLLRLHVCAHGGTRIEETERLFKRIEKTLGSIIPKGELAAISDNIGMPVSGINYAYSDSQTISAADGEILITLSEKRSHSTGYYQKTVRQMMKSQYPECTFYFQPADIVTQIINAGLPAPIDVKILGMKRAENYKIAQQVKHQIELIPGAVDVCLHQVTDAPHFGFEVDRVRAKQVGLTQQDISNSLLIPLSSSFQTQPNFWLNRTNGINYYLSAQAPQYRLKSLDDLRNLPVTSQYVKTDKPQPELLTNLAVPSRSRYPAVVNHLNVQPAFDIYAACQDRDLGGVSSEIKKILDEHKKIAPRGTFMFMGGQVKSMFFAYASLMLGLLFAVVLVYLLLVVNFQSWLDPLIILMAIPGAFSGILWSLFVTQTNFSIPALMGAIMTVGVASANSILMVTFANEQLSSGQTAKEAALSAGYQRFRPVMMTATAMIIGMIPMAVGGGQGGSQNAPIGRAVIGGLTVATFSTLLFVPLMFSIVKAKWAGASKD
jgi:multidrug efflux pump subunit AcrB